MVPYFSTIFLKKKARFLRSINSLLRSPSIVRTLTADDAALLSDRATVPAIVSPPAAPSGGRVL